VAAAGRGHHLHDLATLAARLLAGHRDDWLAARPEELDADDVKAILAAGRDLNFTGSVAGKRDKALAYFEHKARRMRYQHYRDLGMFAGSGVVEAGCKQIVRQRLKLSGMRWTLNGAYGILTLRCLEAAIAGTRSGTSPARPAPRDLASESAPQSDDQKGARLSASHLHSRPTPMAMLDDPLFVGAG
jgi:hypothetical protein